MKAKIRELSVYKQQQNDYDSLYEKLLLKDKKIDELSKRLEGENEHLAKVFKELTIEQDRKKVLENKITTIEKEYNQLKSEINNLEVLLNEKEEGKKVI